MDDDIARGKLDKNIERAGAVSALRKMHRMVESIDRQDRRNRIRAVVLALILLVTVIVMSYLILNREPVTHSINSSRIESFENKALLGPAEPLYTFS